MGPAAAGAGAGAAAGAAATGIAIGSIIRGILVAIAVLLGALLGAAIIGAILVFTGKPTPCADRTIPTSAAASTEMRARWDAFTDQASAGPASITYNEEEITSRGVDYIDEKDLPVENLQVYLCPNGLGEGTGTITTPGRKINVLVRGTLDLSGPKPVIHVRDIEAGNLPSAVGTRVVNAALGSGWKTLNMKAHLTGIQISDGEVALDGAP